MGRGEREREIERARERERKRERERERERAREKKAVQEMNQSSTVSLILNLIQDEIINQFPPTKTRNH